MLVFSTMLIGFVASGVGLLGRVVEFTALLHGSVRCVQLLLENIDFGRLSRDSRIVPRILLQTFLVGYRLLTNMPVAASLIARFPCLSFRMAFVPSQFGHRVLDGRRIRASLH